MSSSYTQHEEDEQMQPGAWPANVKRTYDEFQDISLTSARRSQVNFDHLNSVALQALQNAVETANMVGKNALQQSSVVNTNAADTSNATNKQAVKHSDVAVTANLGVGVAAEGVAAVVVKALDANNTVLMKSLDATISPMVAVLADMVKALALVTEKLGIKADAA